MRPIAFVTICLAMTLPFLGNAFGQEKSQSAFLLVLLPDKDAKLRIDAKETRQEGTTRLFVTPPLPPGKMLSYTLTAVWDQNNYTEVIRTRVVAVQAGKLVEIDLRAADPASPDKFEINFVPTLEEVVEAMCRLADVGKNDVVYDLGCGDGRIVITAVSKFNAKKGVGIDLSAALVKSAAAHARKANVGDKIEFRKQDVQTIKDLRDATVVMLYMGEEMNLALMPMLKKTLKPGARIVSHDFKMGAWQADRTLKVADDDGEDHLLYLWTVKK